MPQEKRGPMNAILFERSDKSTLSFPGVIKGLQRGG
jgi:hypothetical protein